MSTQRLLTSVLAVAAGLVLLACNGGPEGEPLATTDADLFAEDAARAVEVELRDIAFGPTDLTVGAGELVELAIVHTGSLDHDFTIDRIPAQVSMRGNGPSHGSDADVHVGVDPDGQAVLRLRVAEPGEYRYYCSVSGHRSAGMQGTLTVE